MYNLNRNLSAYVCVCGYLGSDGYVSNNICAQERTQSL